jgi:hypothetical protein
MTSLAVKRSQDKPPASGHQARVFDAPCRTQVKTYFGKEGRTFVRVAGGRRFEIG